MNEKFVVVAFGEVKVQKDLVYDTWDQLVGFVNFGNFNNQLHTLKETCQSCTTFKPDTVATHVLVFMVLGLFTNLEYPYAQFTTTTASGVQLFSVVWDVVWSLEGCGLKVIVLSCDRASPNRKFIKMHKSSQGDKSLQMYITINPFSPELLISEYWSSTMQCYSSTSRELLYMHSALSSNYSAISATSHMTTDLLRSPLLRSTLKSQAKLATTLAQNICMSRVKAELVKKEDKLSSWK